MNLIIEILCDNQIDSKQCRSIKSIEIEEQEKFLGYSKSLAH